MFSPSLLRKQPGGRGRGHLRHQRDVQHLQPETRQNRVDNINVNNMTDAFEDKSASDACFGKLESAKGDPVIGTWRTTSKPLEREVREHIFAGRAHLVPLLVRADGDGACGS